jgi:hypothetical protein
MFLFTIYIVVFSEIPNFLSSEEADHIIGLAKKAGMHTSDLHMDPITTDHMKQIRSTEGTPASYTHYYATTTRSRQIHYLALSLTSVTQN